MAERKSTLRATEQWEQGRQVQPCNAFGPLQVEGVKGNDDCKTLLYRVGMYSYKYIHADRKSTSCRANT